MWVFSKLRNDETRTDDPTSKLFEGLGDVEALLREALQNALDAKSTQSSAEPVVVKIGLKDVDFSENSWMLESSKDLGSLNDHFEEARSQRNTNYPKNLNGITKCLTIEDFNTTGLCGPFDKTSKDKGSLVRYWWENNISDKDSNSGGSHGLGKETYNLASGSRTVYVMSSREEDNNDQILLGFARPGRHDYSGREYKDYVRFGCVEGTGDDPKISPYSLQRRNDNNIEKKLSEFCKFFNLKRRENQCGTSFVITNVSETFSKERILRSLLKNFYLPVLNGDIEIYLDTGEEENTSITKDAILEIIDQDDIEIDRPSFSRELALCGFLIDQKGFYSQSTEVDFKNRCVFDEESFSTLNLQDMRNDYLEKKPVKFSLIVPVKEVGEASKNGRIDIVLQSRSATENDTFFSVFRGNINILKQGESYSRVLKDVDGIVNIPPFFGKKANPLSDFFRYCEDPGHVKWNSSPNRKNEKRRYGETWQRDFVVGLPIAIAKVLKGEKTKKVHNFLETIFSILRPSDLGDETMIEEVTDSNNIVLPPPDLPKKLEAINIIKDSEDVGFSVSGNREFQNDFKSLPKDCLEIKLSVGYAGLFLDQRKALSNSIREIELAKDFEIQIHGAEIVRSVANTLWLRLHSSSFSLSVTGFDKNRDLTIDVDDRKLVKALSGLKAEAA